MRAIIRLTPTVRRLVVLAIVALVVAGAGALSAAHAALYWANYNGGGIGGIAVSSLDGSGVRQLIGANNPAASPSMSSTSTGRSGAGSRSAGRGSTAPTMTLRSSPG